jgi:hypothetical protein
VVSLHAMMSHFVSFFLRFCQTCPIQCYSLPFHFVLFRFAKMTLSGNNKFHKVVIFFEITRLVSVPFRVSCSDRNSLGNPNLNSVL